MLIRAPLPTLEVKDRKVIIIFLPIIFLHCIFVSEHSVSLVINFQFSFTLGHRTHIPIKCLVLLRVSLPMWLPHH